jgi:Flp pilus assembly protein TadB
VKPTPRAPRSAPQGNPADAATQTELLEKRKKRVPLQDQIYQAGLKTKACAFIRNQIIVGAVVFVVCFVLQVPLLFALVFGVAGGYLLPRMYLGPTGARGSRRPISTNCPMRSRPSCAA